MTPDELRDEPECTFAWAILRARAHFLGYETELEVPPTEDTYPDLFEGLRGAVSS